MAKERATAGKPAKKKSARKRKTTSDAARARTPEPRPKRIASDRSKTAKTAKKAKAKTPEADRGPNDAFLSVTTRQQAFVTRYLVHFNATRAYLEAGYKPKAASAGASRLLRNVKVQAAVSEQLANHGIDPNSIKISVAQIALGSDIADFEPYLTGDKTLDQLRKDGVDTSLVESVWETTRTYADESSATTRKIKLYSRMTAMGLLARVLGMVSEGRVHSGQVAGGAPGLLITAAGMRDMSDEELGRLAAAAGLDQPDGADREGGGQVGDGPA